MNQLALVALVALVAVMAFLLGRRNASANEREDIGTTSDTVKPSDAALQNSDKPRVNTLEHVEQVLPPVYFEESQALIPYEEKTLIEVTDPKLIASIDCTIPIVVRRAANAASILSVSAAINAYNVGADAAEPVYRAIIPKGAKLANSRSMEGAFRGIYHGPDGIAGQANLKQVDPTKLDPNIVDTMKIAGAVDAAMSVGALVVGQYYMTQINSELKGLRNAVDRIGEFQELEYRNKVRALVHQMQRSAEFRFETMESESLRHIEIHFLKEREQECAELLGHANDMLRSIADPAKRESMSYEDYEIAVEEADKWCVYQQTLASVQVEIAKLIYTLGMGELSLENSKALCKTYITQANEAMSQLSYWHGDMMSRFEFAPDKSKRKRMGAGGVLMSVPGAFNDELNYIPVKPKTRRAIERHFRTRATLGAMQGSDLYQQDVNLVLKGSRVYYLPETNRQ